MVNTARTRLVLWTVAACLMLASVVAAIAAALPLRLPETDQALLPAEPSDSRHTEAGSLPSETELAEVWDRDLQRPLFDEPQIVVPEKAPELTIRLAGTVIEAGRSEAMFVTQAGQVQRCSVGEMIDGQAKLLEIHTDDVVVLHNGREVTLKIEPMPEERRRRR